MEPSLDELKAENARLQAFILDLAERVFKQHELLGKRAEKEKKEPVKCYLMERYLGRKCDGA